MAPLELHVVAFVLRHQPYIAAPKELASEISIFLGPSSNLSLSDACKLGSIPLLDWIWESSCTSAATRTSGWSLTNFLRSDKLYYRWQFSKALEVVASRGDLRLLQWLFEHFSGCVGSVEAVEAAAANGHLAVLQYLLDRDMGQEHDHGAVGFVRESVEWNGPGNRVRWGGKSMVKAIENGNPEVARWLYKNTLYDPTDSEIDLVVCGALKLGDIELAQLFVSPTRSIFDYASGCPHPDVVEMMLENGCLGWSQDAAGAAMRALAIHGRLDLMKRVAQVYTAPPSNEDAWLNGWRLAMIEAIKRGDLLMLQWLGKHPSGRELLSKHKVNNEYLGLNAAAATKGYVDVMHYLHNEGFADEYEGALIAAVRSGRLDSVKWLLPRVRRLTNANLMDEAAVYGHLEILQYFHDTDLPELPRLSCSSEKELVYLNANSDSSLKSLLRDITALEMIRSTGCSVQAMNFSAARGHLEVVKWLHNHCVEGCTTLAMDNAAASGHLDVVKWLHFNRSEGCTTHAMDVAAQERHLDTVKWLYANRSEGCTFRAIEMATTNGHLRVACWLRVHYPQHFVAMVGKSISTESALDILLFLHVHCAHVFTIWFCARLRRPLLSSSVESYDLVAQWLEKHYPDHETEIQ